MENDKKCLKCDGELQYDKGDYVCSKCGTRYEAEYLCDKCGSKVEKLQACGALNFFCNSCNELKSKSKIIKEYKEK